MKLGLFKHRNNTDVAMKIMKSTKRDDGYSVVVLWYNIVNPKKIYLMDSQVHVEFVTNEQVKNWEPYRAEV